MKHFSALVCLMTSLTLFAQPPGKNGGNTAPSGNSPTGNTPPPSSGASSGSPPIEATLFAYKALTANAKAISREIGDVSGIDKSIVIAAPTDLTALVQWRSVMGQLDVLQKRAGNRGSIADVNLPTFPGCLTHDEPNPDTSINDPFAFIANPADAQTLVQTALTLASAFAVNESLAPSAGAIADTPLMNVVARYLRSRVAAVYIPSVYAPSMFSRSNLEGTFVGQGIAKLEDSRRAIGNDVQKYSHRLDDARTVSLFDPQHLPPGCTIVHIARAKAISDQSSGIKAFIASLTTLVAAIDTFEGSLFSGQGPSQSQNSAPSGPGSPGSPGGPGVPAGPVPAGLPVATPPTSNPPSVPLLGNGNPGGTTLQQIMLADLLAHKIWKNKTPPSDDDLKNLYFLTLHTLESGGGILTKGNLFTGNRVYFGGGAVATFSLFGTEGSIVCSGYAYDYSGYVREKDFDKALRSEKSTTAILNTDSSCTATR